MRECRQHYRRKGMSMKHLARAVAPAVALGWLWISGLAPAAAQSLSSLATAPDPQALRAFALVQHRPFEKRPLVITMNVKSAKERGTFDLTFRGWSQARVIGEGWIERQDWIQTMSARASFKGQSGSAEYVWPDFMLFRVVYDKLGHKREVQDFSARAPAPSISSAGSADAQSALKGVSGAMLRTAAGWLSELVVNYADRQVLVGTTFHPFTIDEYLDWGRQETLAPAIRGQTGRDATPEEARRALAAVKMKTWNNEVRVRGMSRIESQEVIDYSGRLSWESQVNGRDNDYESNTRYLIDPYTGLIRRSGQTGIVAFDFRGRNLALDFLLTTDSPPPPTSVPPAPSPSTTSKAIPVAPGGSEPNSPNNPPVASTTPAPSTDSPTELSVADIYDRCLPAVVFIGTSVGTTGSGFFISETDIVTNHHVVASDNIVQVLLSDGRGFDARVVKIDKQADLALLRLSQPARIQPLSLRVGVPRIGEQVLVIGAPRNLPGTLTGGLISQLRSFDGVAVVQTDAAINPGNSGGPLLDRRGQVIGVVRAYRKDSEALGFAIAADEVRRRLHAP